MGVMCVFFFLFYFFYFFSCFSVFFLLPCKCLLVISLVQTKKDGGFSREYKIFYSFQNYSLKTAHLCKFDFRDELIDGGKGRTRDRRAN